MKKIWIALWAICILAASTSSAAAAPADRDRDGLPDRWEKKHNLSVKRASAAADPDRDRVDNRSEFRVGTDPTERDSDKDHHGDGREDFDRDGLTNAAEDASGNDPADADTDDDGVADGDEHAGTIASFTDGRLTVALAGGGRLIANVTEDTDIGCGTPAEAELLQGSLSHLQLLRALKADPYEPDADDSEDYGDGLDANDAERMDDEHDFEDTCAARSLRPGVHLREASLELGTGPADFGEVELLLAR